jgi:hypothetical protein
MASDSSPVIRTAHEDDLEHLVRVEVAAGNDSTRSG